MVWVPKPIHLSDYLSTRNLAALRCTFHSSKAMYDYAELREHKETANILTGIDHWPDLYDEVQHAKNEVPVYSSVSVDDMYVNFDFATENVRGSRIVGPSLKTCCIMTA